MYTVFSNPSSDCVSKYSDSEKSNLDTDCDKLDCLKKKQGHTCMSGIYHRNKGKLVGMVFKKGI